MMWTAEELAQLEEAAEEASTPGAVSWVQVAAQLGNRTPKYVDRPPLDSTSPWVFVPRRLQLTCESGHVAGRASADGSDCRLATRTTSRPKSWNRERCAHAHTHAHTRTRAQLLSGLWHGSAYRVTAVWAHTSFDVCPENDQQEPPAPLDGSRGNQTPEGGRQAGTALRQRYGTHHSQTYTPTLPAHPFSCVVCRVVYVCRVVGRVVVLFLELEHLAEGCGGGGARHGRVVDANELRGHQPRPAGDRSQPNAPQ